MPIITEKQRNNPPKFTVRLKQYIPLESQFSHATLEPWLQNETLRREDWEIC